MKPNQTHNTMKKFKMIGLPLIALVLWVVSGTNPVNPEASQKIDLAGLAQTSANGESSGWFWQARTESCTYTITTTITIGVGVLSYSRQRKDTYSGTRRVCDDGWSLCFSTRCS